MSSLAQEAEAPASIDGIQQDRLAFIDNVRWVVILLVLSMHAADTYSPFGSWYYTEHPRIDRASLLFFATYQSFLQAFFMSLLFFVSGYFVPRSYDRKSAAAFLRDRLVRLGVPTLLFVVAIGPLTEYFVAHSWHTRNSFPREMAVYFERGRFLAGTGPLWFCVALLVFSFGYAAYRQLRSPQQPPQASEYRPDSRGVALTVAAIALATFLVRIPLPAGTAVYNMQLGDFPSYIVMFCLGIAAGRQRWLERTADGFAWKAAAVCLAIAGLAWLPLLAYGGAAEGRLAPYDGGLHWQSAGMATWEALVCVGMAFAVLAGFRAFAASQRRFSKFMSDNAFAVYVIHPPLLIAVALLLAPFAFPPAEKFVLLWMLSAVLCFAVCAPLARRLPMVGRYLQ